MSVQPLPPESRVLVILMGSLGDVARGLSILPPLRRALPSGRIAWLVEPACEGLVRLHPLVDQVLVFDRPRGVGAVPALAKQLREERFDLVLDLQRHFKSGLFSRLTGAPRRIGFHRRDAKEGNWLFQTETIPPFDPGRPKLEQYRLFLERLGIPPGEVEFGFEPAEHPALAPLRAKAAAGVPLVGMVLGSSWESKDWPIEGYRQLRDRLLTETRAEVVLLGDRSHRERAAALVGDPRVHDYAGKTTPG
jgi:heptosyltransferase I